jgi:hypothetical protein
LQTDKAATINNIAQSKPKEEANRKGEVENMFFSSIIANIYKHI